MIQRVLYPGPDCIRAQLIRQDKVPDWIRTKQGDAGIGRREAGVQDLISVPARRRCGSEKVDVVGNEGHRYLSTLTASKHLAIDDRRKAFEMRLRIDKREWKCEV